MAEIEHKNEIILTYQAGTSITKIGKQFGLSRYFILQLLKSNNITIRAGKSYNGRNLILDQNEIETLYASGLSTIQIAKLKNCSDETIRKRIKNMRTMSERNKHDTACRTKIASSCREKWKDPEYKEKVRVGTSTPEYRTMLSETGKRNVATMVAWSKSEEGRQFVSLCGKKQWKDVRYREKTIAEIRTRWKTQEYRDKIATTMSSPRYREAMSVTIKTRWEDIEYKKKMAAIMSSPEHRKKMVAIMSSQEFREKLTIIMASPEVRGKLAIAMSAPGYKENMVAAIKALWKDPEYRKRIMIAMSSPEVRKKIAAASKARWDDLEYREKMAVTRAAQKGHISSIQTALYTYLDELGVEYYKEGEQTRVGFYVFDCLVVSNQKKLLIECQGDYWHALKDVERRDKGKFTYINRYFPEYEVMYVWEHEFHCKDRVLDRLKLKLGIDIETINFEFSNVVVKKIDYNEAKQFLSLYHYLGKDRGGQAIGVFFGDLLIAVIVFSPPLRQNTAGQFGLVDGEVRELSRLCIHPSYHKKNFASWLIKQAIKRVDSKLIIAYADTTVGHTGTIYKASNFTLHHTVPADYWYVDKEGYVMHKRTLYGRAQSLKMTESEFAESKGYAKKYGGEKLCFIY